MEAATATAPSVTEPRRELRELLPTGRRAATVGLVGAGLAIASAVDFGFSGRALVGLILCPVLVLLAAIDVQHRLLPNAVVFPSVLLVALIIAAADPAGFFDHLWAGLALFGFLFFFAAFFPAGLGMGDAKVGLLIGLALGSRTFAAMVATSAAAFVAALWILARQGSAGRKQSIPFGPYLALGAILAFFFA